MGMPSRSGPEPSALAAPLLGVRDLVVGYGPRDVLRGISLDIARGQLVAVVGPNGHGKTTLLRAISGLLTPRAGAVSLAGRSLAGLAPETIAAAGIAHVPQGDLLFPALSVRENLLMGAYLERSPGVIAQRLDRVQKLLPRLLERRNQKAASLSGGERRMVGIGRGLMMGAPVMLIDEPSLGLAPLVTHEIYEVIARLKDEGQTILLVDENPARAAELADAVHLLDNGALVWSGAPADLLDRGELLETYLGG